MIPRLINKLHAVDCKPGAEVIAEALWMLHALALLSEKPAAAGGVKAQPRARSMYRRSAPIWIGARPRSRSPSAIPDPPSLIGIDDKVSDSDKESDEASTELFPSSGEQPSAIEIAGVRIWAPGAPALTERVGMARSLRPFAKRIPSRTRTILDVDATTRRAGGLGVLVPVFQPLYARWLSMHLVFDMSSSLAIWYKVTSELRELFLRLGAFRNIKLWTLNAEDPDAPFARIAPMMRSGAVHVLRSPGALIDPSGQTIVLVVSDCVAPGWWSGSVAKSLEMWGRSGPTAILQLLPQRLWSRSSLGRELGATLWSMMPGASNASLKAKIAGSHLLQRRGALSGVKVPVLTLDAESLGTWARMVAGHPGSKTPGFLFSTGRREVVNVAAASEKTRLDRFIATTSPGGVQLATLLAGAPVISLPIIRVIQREAAHRGVLPCSDYSHLAEVFLGGLLHPIVQSDNPEAVLYDFIPGVREQLLREAHQVNTATIYDLVSSYIAHSAGDKDGYAAIAASPLGVLGHLPVAVQKAFASATVAVLRDLGERDLADAVQRVAQTSVAAATAMVQFRGRALLIGVGSWEHLTMRNPQVTAWEAETIAAALRDPQTCRYPSEHVTLLMHADATRERILGALNRLIDESNERDVVLLHYSGHWDRSEDGRPCLTAHDTRGDFGAFDVSTVITADELIATVKQLRSRSVLLCFTASSPSIPTEVCDALVRTGNERLVLVDVELGGSPSFDIKKGITLLGMHLASALRANGMPNRNGYISVFDLYAQLRRGVATDALETFNQVQEPALFAQRNAMPFPIGLHREAEQPDEFVAPPEVPEGIHWVDSLDTDNSIAVSDTLSVSEDVSMDNVAAGAGINVGTIQAFFGAAPPADAKELLDSYLESLVAEYGRLRLGKLLGKQQTGREQTALPALSLRAVYTALATNVRLPRESFANLDRTALLEAIDAGDPNTVLPDLVRLAVIRADERQLDRATAPSGPPAPMLSAELLAAQWAALRREVEAAPDAPIAGQWYRPELPINAIGAHRRLVLLGSPGSGKSTALRFLTVWMSEMLLNGRDPSKPPLPVPFFCELGRVAQELGDDPARDLDTLIAALLAPVIGAAGLRAELRETIFQAWRRGGALLCLDGLDGVAGVAEPTRAGARSRRERLADAIRQLAGQLDRAWFVVTCRTKPYEQSAAWQLRDDWAVRVLEPFTLGQVRHFVPAWYAQTADAPQALYTAAEARDRAAHLVDVLAQRPNLQELTASPLLLTMLVLLHYNKKQLPEERAEIYEEMVALLLDRWEGVRSADVDRRVATVGERLGLPQLTTDDLRPVIHEIAFAAHQQAVDGRRVLSGELMSRTLDGFFAHKIQPADPRAVPRSVCAAKSEMFITLLREETGLVQKEGDDAYVLSHLTFEEYLAACHLAGREDIDLSYTQWRDGGDRWREVLLLLMGRLRRQEKFALAYAWLDLLVATRNGSTPKPAAQRQRDVLLAAACYAALGGRAAFAGRPHDLIGFEERLRAALVELLERPEPEILLSQRIEAGDGLGGLGDPRFPVAIDDWRRELLKAQSGDTSGYLCRVEAGIYIIGSTADDVDAQDNEQPQHIVTFSEPFWIGRYPITNAQWLAGVAQGGELSDLSDSNDLNNPSQPVVGVSWDMAVSYCEWLSNQVGVEVRLPSEAEWETSARGPDARRYPWGEQWHDGYAATAEGEQIRGSQWSVPVGIYPEGSAMCGALDMVGNVWEWTAVVWQSYPGAKERFIEEDDCVLRGGSYANDKANARCAVRNRLHRDQTSFNGGFRVVVASRLAQ